MKLLDLWKSSFSKEKRMSDEAEELKRGFQVREQKGKLYLVAHGIAFAIVDENATAQDIAALITEARSAAEDYYKVTKL
jgi:hypothetical protein